MNEASEAEMARIETTAAETGGGAAVLTRRAPVLAVRLGRGRTGGTTFLDWTIQRARSQGREVIVADGDRRNADLAALYPGQAMQPPSDDTGDVKEWISAVLVRMIESGQSVALDLGGGDRVLPEYGRDLALVDFCQEAGAQPLALCFLGPDTADLEHVLTIVRAGYFRPQQMLLVLNENLVPSHKSPAAAFETIVARAEFAELVSTGAQPIYLPTLPCMDRIRQAGVGFYSTDKGLDPVRAFMVRRWVARLESEVSKAGAAEWLP
jgi:hypothetical protein